MTEELHSQEQFIWNSIWSRDIYGYPNIRTKRASKKIQEVIQKGFYLNQEDKLLEIGCGSGAVLAEIALKFPGKGDLFGCDISNVALDIAQSNFNNYEFSIKLYKADVSHLPFDNNYFNKIIAFGVLEHISDEKTAISEIDRIILTGGEIYFCTSNKYSFVYLIRKLREIFHLWPYGYQKNYTPKKFCELLGNFSLDKPSIIQTDFDFPLLAILDRLVNTVFPLWGRYIVLKCKKV
jgi:ubiquinone/menaquinone biosynthesis C-methylase UbiE